MTERLIDRINRQLAHPWMVRYHKFCLIWIAAGIFFGFVGLLLAVVWILTI